jgi:glycosyltransferase involved in cell wall biosynthesis
MAAFLSSKSLTLIYLTLVFFEWSRRIVWARRFQARNPAIQPASGSISGLPKVSVIIPARNEETNIARCLVHFFKQNYPSFEIIVVDDRSDDRTPHLLDNLKQLSPVPFKVVRIEKLPPGWTGKNHAMAAGAKAASGDWLLFTDADTTHQAHSILSSVQKAVNEKIDFLTLAPEVECISFWENVVQPLAVSSLALWFNTTELNQPNSKTVLANGQFILIRKDVYEKTGGSESVKNEVVEDVEYAKKVKAAGFNVKFYNGTELYSTRMYTSLMQIKTGWTRIFTHLFNKKLLPILHKIFLFLFFSIAPFIITAFQITLWVAKSLSFDGMICAVSVAVCLWIIFIRFFGNRLIRSNPFYAFLHPLGSLVMVWILFVCVVRIIFNRPSVWRGQSY